MNPLNIQLYNALLKLYGDVKIAGAGHTGGGLVYTKGKSPNAYYARTVEQAEHYQICCPVCNDKRYRLYINYLVGAKLTYKGKPVRTYGMMGCKNESCKTILMYQDIIKAMGEVPDFVLPKVAPSYRQGMMELPSNSRQINKAYAHVGVINYLKNRGFDINELGDKYNVRAVSSLIDYPSFGPMAIFPVIEGNQPVMWQGRVANDVIQEYVPKYFFPAGSKKSQHLYNRDNAHLSPRVYLTEGVLDTIRIGDGAVALFGKCPSNRQMQIISTVFSKKEGVLVLDPDAFDEMKIWYDKYKDNLFEKGLRMCRLPEGTDPADYSADTVKDVIENHII